jgi:hypothetical protein
MNIPDEFNPPYYIDQTRDWRHMLGDYKQCLKHAVEHWNLPDYDGPDVMRHGILCSSKFFPANPEKKARNNY